MSSNNRRNFLQQLGLLTAAGAIPNFVPLQTKAAGRNTTPGLIVREGYAGVETSYGKVRGYSNNGIFTFKGIPYGATTAGKNRFMPPLKPAAWTGVKDALVYGPICPQKTNTGWHMQEYAFLYQWVDGLQEEDCLRLNIWSPQINDGKKRPVLFWIHGGGFFSGSSQEHPSYDGENLSSLGDVVVVSVNHRLNVFGHLDLSAFSQAYKASANVGMLDIVAALEWVKDNIAAFGGDPHNVTIFGQSGGGSKVITLMAMPSAKGLFHKAICQSNSIVQVATPAYAGQLAALILKQLDITGDKLDRLHDAPVASLIAAYQAAEKEMGQAVPPNVGRPGLQPVADGHILPTHPFDPVASPLSANIPFMVGSNRNEASASIGNPQLENLDEAGLKNKLTDRFGNKGETVYLTLRKTHPQVKPVEILSFLSAQNAMAHLMASRKAMQNAAPAFLYLFNYKTPVLDGRPRAFHCSELPFVFNNTERCITLTGGGPRAAKLGKQMAMAWINFARSGNPSTAGLPAWPAFTEAKKEMMVFDITSSVQKDPDGSARELLEKIYYNKEI